MILYPPHLKKWGGFDPPMAMGVAGGAATPMAVCIVNRVPPCLTATVEISYYQEWLW